MPSSKQEMSDLVTALNHPLRRAILRLFFEDDTPKCPTELADLLDEALSNVSYHVTQLVERKGLRLDHTKPGRGSIGHWYVIGGLITRNRTLAETLVAE
jgi:DNA-binding transcriptional ArsR family regulator